MKRVAGWIGVVLCLVVLPSLVQGQPHQAEGQPKGYANVNGVAVVTAMPNALRMRMEVWGTGKDDKLALENLKERIELAKTQLVTWGIEKKSIVVENMQVAFLNRMMNGMPIPFAAQFAAGGAPDNPNAGDPKANQEETAYISVELTAELALDPKKDSDELMTEVQELQQKIDNADLGGFKEMMQTVPEEIRNSPNYINYGSNWPKPHRFGDVIYLYSAQIDDASYRTAVKEAFENAKSEAEVIAEATGMKVGPLTSVNTSIADANNYQFGNMWALQQQVQTPFGQRTYRLPVGKQRTRAASTMTPGNVEFTVTVNGSYGLIP